MGKMERNVEFLIEKTARMYSRMNKEERLKHEKGLAYFVQSVASYKRSQLEEEMNPLLFDIGENDAAAERLEKAPATASD